MFTFCLSSSQTNTKLCESHIIEKYWSQETEVILRVWIQHFHFHQLVQTRSLLENRSMEAQLTTGQNDNPLKQKVTDVLKWGMTISHPDFGLGKWQTNQKGKNDNFRSLNKDKSNYSLQILQKRQSNVSTYTPCVKVGIVHKIAYTKTSINEITLKRILCECVCLCSSASLKSVNSLLFPQTSKSKVINL